MRWLVLPRARAAGVVLDVRSVGAATARVGAAATLFLPVALLLVFVRQLVEFRDPFVPWSEDARLLLTGTAWGRTWTLWLVLACLAPVLFARAARKGGWAWPAATACTLALGAFPALTGHANTPGPLRPLALAADTLHVWSAGAWIGGLGTMLWLEAWWRRKGRGGPGLLPALVPRFSPVALVSAAVLVATGTFGGWMHLPSVPAIWSGAYGRTLALKVLLVAAVLALGFVNWRRMRPALGRPGGPERLARVATGEFLLAQLVLLVTAILVQTPPGG